MTASAADCSRAGLQELERLGLAERERGDRWTISASAEPTLRALSERGDIIRTMQRAMGEMQRSLAIHDADDASARPIVGRIAAKGLVDELQDRGFLVVDALDGRAHYVRLPDRAELAAFPVGGVVEVCGAAREPRPADRTIAAETGPDGFYRADRHLAAVRAAARPSDNPDAYVTAHVRRLEAMRQAGLVERVSEGVWRVPADYLDRAAAHEASQSAGAVVELRSHLDIRAQARAIGATWLDRALIEDVRPAPVGFGAEVRAALDDRRSMLEAEGLATRRGQRLILTRDLLATLRTKDVAQAGTRMATETGLDIDLPVTATRCAACTGARLCWRAVGSRCSMTGSASASSPGNPYSSSSSAARCARWFAAALSHSTFRGSVALACD